MIVECSITLGFNIKYLIDINTNLKSNEKISGVSVKPKEYLNKIGKGSNVFIAVGDNNIREKIFLKYKNFLKFINLIHPSSFVAKNVKLGKANFIGPKVIINSDTKINDNCIINSGSIIEHECKLMNNVHVGPGSIVCGRVKLKKNCFIGAGSKIIQNITIKENCIIGAGSVVLSHTKSNCTYIGSPAKLKIKDITK